MLVKFGSDTIRRIASFGAVGFVAAGYLCLAQTSKTEPRLENLLKRFPQADTNDDNILTQEEALDFLESQGKRAPARQGDQIDGGPKLPQGAVKYSESVQMRDGVRLATDIYLPAGKGPWPAVLVRTPYNRKEARQAGKASPLVANGYAVVIQDWRGLYESEKRFPPKATVGTTNPEDGYDTVEWIAKQSWCTGKVGIKGGSGPGFAAKQAVLSNPPHLVAAAASVSGMFPRDFAFYHGGVPVAWADVWVRSRGIQIPEWPKPRPLELVTNVGTGPGPLVFGPWPPLHKEAGPAGRIALLDHGGWFDFFTPAAFDDFRSLHGCNNRVIMAAKAHGTTLAGLQYPSQNLPEASELAWFEYWLKGIDNGVMNSPPIRYFLMGDTMRKGAPGNVWKQADTWPIPNKRTSYYLFVNGSLQTRRPPEKNTHLTYAYDPNDPLSTVGLAEEGKGRGPVDRRALKDRKDILRFATEPLTQPVEITGRVLAELYVTSDVPDTAVFASLVDIYPNGYEAQMLNNSLMARYWDGFQKPAPLQPGKVYKLTIDMWPTAVVFDKGHRIGLQIASSSRPHWEVHPNSYEPVSSFENAPVAHISVQASAEHPSRLILPVIAPGVSEDYARRR